MIVSVYQVLHQPALIKNVYYMLLYIVLYAVFLWLCFSESNTGIYVGLLHSQVST